MIIYNQCITNIHLYLYISEKQYGNIVKKIKESKFTDIMWNIIYIYLNMVFLKFTCNCARQVSVIQEGDDGNLKCDPFNSIRLRVFP